MTLDRRRLFRGLVLAPGTLLRGRQPRRLVMSERFVVEVDLTVESFVWALEYWREDFPGFPLPTVIEVCDEAEKHIAMKITRLTYREDFRDMRVVVLPPKAFPGDYGDWALREE